MESGVRLAETDPVVVFGWKEGSDRVTGSTKTGQEELFHVSPLAFYSLTDLLSGVGSVTVFPCVSLRPKWPAMIYVFLLAV